MAWDALDQVANSMRVSRRKRTAIERELRSHLEESRSALERAGLDPADARRESLTRFGDPAEIAVNFENVYRPKRRTQVGVALALACAMFIGVHGIDGSLARAHPAQHATHHTQHTHIVRNHVLR